MSSVYIFEMDSKMSGPTPLTSTEFAKIHRTCQDLSLEKFVSLTNVAKDQLSFKVFENQAKVFILFNALLIFFVGFH